MRSTEEIEVTPAMIAAGLLELHRYSPERDLAEDAVAAIYRAMISAQRKSAGIEAQHRVMLSFAPRDISKDEITTPERSG